MYKPNSFRPDPKPEKNKKKPRKRIRHLSVKRERQNKIYLEKRKKYLEANPDCELAFDVCTKQATEIHHERGRIGDLLTDERYFKATCRCCHDKHHFH